MDRIYFKINGEQYSVGPEVSSDETLLDYIRNCLDLRGTKYMCREGGCGACIVSAVKSPGAPVTAVNSCLVPITLCNDWDVTTIEKIGNRLTGYNKIQTTLAEENGTQCGHCTPGFIMNMYSLLKSKPNLTMLEIEKSFDSNICRCTGYRPILDAFKKFAKDAPKKIYIPDIEDLNICKKTKIHCSKKDNRHCYEEGWCTLNVEDVEKTTIKIDLTDGRQWYRTNYLNDVFQILDENKEQTYMLVNGNTGKGAYPIDEYPNVLIDISGIEELKGYMQDQNLIIGAGNTLTEFMNTVKLASKWESFKYLEKLYDHLEEIANVSVRNLGTIGGNLMLKHQHPEFSSDFYLLFETIGAEITIVSKSSKKILSMQKFLQEDMNDKIIQWVLLPPLNESYKIETFKITPRAQNSSAIVNAGFLYKLDADNKVLTARIVYGGLSGNFSRADSTENYLKGKDLFNNQTLQIAINKLKVELIIDDNPTGFPVEYRRKLAIGLFYKGLVIMCPIDQISSQYRSATITLKRNRPVSNGKQSYVTNPEIYPLNKPVMKVEALIQCSGEAVYTDDMPCIPHEIFAEEVLAIVPNGTIASISVSKALSQKGVIAFYSSKDIPGLNSFIPKDQPGYTDNEEIFCIDKVKYHSQPIGVIVATTPHIARKAAKLVQIVYNGVKKPVLDVNEAKKNPSKTTVVLKIKASDPETNINQIIKGNNTIYGQYHFPLETLVTVAKPTEEGLEIHSTTHWINGIQIITSRALLMDENKIDVCVRRLGGSFGIKISRPSQVSAACALVVKDLNKPCRLVTPLTTVMKGFGKRAPCSSEYEVAIDSNGKIQYVTQNLYSDCGWKNTEPIIELGNDVFSNCYDVTKWNYTTYHVLTDTAKNTTMRAPGSLEVIAMAEYIIEKIATVTSRDPLEVRLTNLDDVNYGDLREMVNTIKENSNYDSRKLSVEKYNSENRWKKRGLRFSFLRWTTEFSQSFDVNLSVFSEDGTVSIIHGGVEMGQGINTKAVQVAAYLLNIPMKKIQIKANNTNFTPNCSFTASSSTSQNVAIGVQRCCEQLLERLAPLREMLGNPSWEELVKEAFRQNIDLQSHGFVDFTEKQNYTVFGVALAEVEIDVLTGELEVLRVDLLQDVGQSVSPSIDIGQIEGAFICGLGYWTSERLVYDKSTGELLTDRTWNYKVPQARDIPQDFRIYLRENSYSNPKMFGAKACGEPPACLAVVVPFAIRQAITSARVDSGLPANDWFDIYGPYTIEKICMATETKYEDFKFN